MVYIFFVKHLVFGPQILCSIICFLFEYLMRFDKKKLSQPESQMNLIKSGADEKRNGKQSVLQHLYFKKQTLEKSNSKNPKVND